MNKKENFERDSHSAYVSSSLQLRQEKSIYCLNFKIEKRDKGYWIILRKIKDLETVGSGLAIMNENEIDMREGEGKSLLVAQDWQHYNQFSFWSFEDDNPDCINDFEYHPYDCYYWNE